MITYTSYVYHYRTKELNTKPNEYFRFVYTHSLVLDLIFENGFCVQINELGSMILNIPDEIKNHETIVDKTIEILNKVL